MKHVFCIPFVFLCISFAVDGVAVAPRSVSSDCESVEQVPEKIALVPDWRVSYPPKRLAANSFAGSDMT